jgi:hypothetical protein
MTMLFDRCGRCAFFMQNMCINIKTLSFGENILSTYFSCSGFEPNKPQIKEVILFPEKKVERRKSKTA